MNILVKKLNEKPIAFYPIYVDITGSITSGLLLSQLMYWFSKKDKIFKTDSELMSETKLSTNELRNAKKKIKNLPFITVSREGLPAKTFYKIDWELYQTSLVDFTKQCELNSLDTDSDIHSSVSVKSTNLYYTETTTENTTDIIKREKAKPKKKNKSCDYENMSNEQVQDFKGFVAEKDGGYELEAFEDYHISKGSTYSNWNRAYSGWVRNAQKFNNSKPTNKANQVNQIVVSEMSDEDRFKKLNRKRGL